MKKVIFLFLINLFFLGHSVNAMDREDLSRGISTRFKSMIYENGVLKDLRIIPEDQVRKICKHSAATLGLATFFRVGSASTYVASVCRSAPFIPNHLSPQDLITLSGTAEQFAMVGLSLSCNELYNIYRGSRLLPEFLNQESKQDKLQRNIRNGLIDVGLAGLVYVGYPYVKYWVESYIEHTGGPTALYGGATFFACRGFAGLFVDLPTLAADLDWSVLPGLITQKAVSTFQSVREKVTFENGKKILSEGYSKANECLSKLSAWWNQPKAHTE